MNQTNLKDNTVWNRLVHHADIMNRPENHLKHLVVDPDRIKKFAVKSGGMFFDFSRQRVDEKTMNLLFDLAVDRNIVEQFHSTVAGDPVNVTENRAALHTATRRFSSDPIKINGRDIIPDIMKERERVNFFSHKIRSGEITGSTGKPFEHIVVIGIGGSYLGTEFVSTALYALTDQSIKIHYLSNVDIHNFGRVVSEIDVETTLWVAVSKSYTTAETLANLNRAYEFMREKNIDPTKHVVTVTAKGSPGDDPTNPVLESFLMFDFIGGRYSVTSSVGAVPLSIYLGFDIFEQFLKGAEEMDVHAATSPMGKNIPLIAALISVWNNNFLGYPAHGIIPYASPLAKLAPHVQQLNMESNGKSVSSDGTFLEESTGTIIFGEPGTNAQHSFFQLAHQGRPFPIEFIGILNPQYEKYQGKSKGVTNHQELWANLISQPKALAMGKSDDNTAKHFSGNRPSSTILLNDLSPKNIGRLLSFYEAKTVFEAFIWGINPFDQFGVELGKTMATDIRNETAQKNKNPNHEFDKLDSISKFYLEMLFSGKL